ncbi:hypothetical protein RMSM_04512 [Rhodopirellula maiorica SM1]|uniref:Uncharacterized protein n=1 Tax=Rhodopirellula maiorica SM1 TaxID=1265738 RepID=M5RX87_9BACT|nr:hypothetical protein RMSM_04512 [Rhodopirellula maiorica SM1]
MVCQLDTINTPNAHDLRETCQAIGWLLGLVAIAAEHRKPGDV